MAIPTDMYYFAGSYLAIIIGGFFLLNWLSNGILTKFLKVKASRGTKILLKVHTKLKTYCVAGWLEGEDLLYYDRESKANKQKTPKRITIKTGEQIFYRFMGVWACDIDEATNNPFTFKGEATSGFDSIRWNNIYLRALMKPSAEEKDKIFLFIILGACIITLLVCIMLFVKLGQMQAAINTLSTIKGGSVSGAINVA